VDRFAGWQAERKKKARRAVYSMYFMASILEIGF
jgi:hypothetical protein